MGYLVLRIFSTLVGWEWQGSAQWKPRKYLKAGILQSPLPCGGVCEVYHYFYFYHYWYLYFYWFCFFLLSLPSPKTTLYLRRGFYMFWFSSLWAPSPPVLMERSRLGFAEDLSMGLISWGHPGRRALLPVFQGTWVPKLCFYCEIRAPFRQSKPGRSIHPILSHLA